MSATTFNTNFQSRYVDESASGDERHRAMLAHLLGLLGLMDMFVLGLIGTLVVYLTGRDGSEFVADHAREAVNFQLSLLIYGVIACVTIVMTLGVALILIVPLAIGLWVVRLIVGIMASVAASKGEYYRYPLCLRLLG